MADVNTNTATQTQEQGNNTQTNTTANANTTGAGADNTPKVKTEEEIRAELQKEYEKMADKRVTDAIKKKEKEWADKQAKEKMTEDERRQAEEQERLQAQAKRDLDLTIKGLKLDVVDAVQELGLDAGFRNLIAVEDLATITDEDERKAKLTERVKGMKKLFDAEVAKEVAKAKAEFLKGSTPATGSSSNKRFLPADKLSVGGKAKYLKNRNQKGIMLKESYVNGSFFMEKGMQDAKPRLNRLVESFLQQIGREIEGGSL